MNNEKKKLIVSTRLFKEAFIRSNKSESYEVINAKSEESLKFSFILHFSVFIVSICNNFYNKISTHVVFTIAAN